MTEETLTRSLVLTKRHLDWLDERAGEPGKRSYVLRQVIDEAMRRDSRRVTRQEAKYNVSSR